MTVFNWLSLLGVPALMGAIVCGIYAAFKSQFKRVNAEQNALKLGMQAMLRDRLYQLYRICCTRGGASLLERENFKNLYDQYHVLGANGVMDDIKQRFYALPFREED